MQAMEADDAPLILPIGRDWSKKTLIFSEDPDHSLYRELEVDKLWCPRNE